MREVFWYINNWVRAMSERHAWFRALITVLFYAAMIVLVAGIVDNDGWFDVLISLAIFLFAWEKCIRHDLRQIGIRVSGAMWRRGLLR